MAILKIFDEPAYEGSGDTNTRRKTFRFGQYEIDYIYEPGSVLIEAKETLALERLLQKVEKGQPR